MIENFDIESYKRVGRIAFGASRYEVRIVFPNYTEFKKRKQMILQQMLMKTSMFIMIKKIYVKLLNFLEMQN